MSNTSHGHHIPGSTKEVPINVYRCGGPGVCDVCSNEAQTWLRIFNTIKEKKKMAIRTKKYRFAAGGDRRVRAVRITEKNLPELVAYINRNGGAATGHQGNTRSGRPSRIRIKQRNYGYTWGKKDWRVARVGDFIVRHDIQQEGFEPIEFERIKDDIFEATFVEDK